MPHTPPYHGLIAASFTPMDRKGALNLAAVPQMVQRYIDTGVRGIYACGSTGEGVSLTTDERKAVAEAFIDGSSGRLPIIVQVGHNSLADAIAMAKHAASAGADAISAVPPNYFRPKDIDALVACCAEVSAAAPSLPFYYYHIPVLSGVHVDIAAFLEKAAEVIPAFAGIKFSDTHFDQLHRCLLVADGKYEVFSGVDEMLLSALAIGVQGAVGSFYNFSARLFCAIIDAFEANDLVKAKELQGQAVQLVTILDRAGGLAAFKRAMSLSGTDCGTVRLPQAPSDDDRWKAALVQLENADLMQWLT